MKFSTALALLVIAGIAATGDALPARKNRQYLIPGMVYYQQPAAAEWYGSAPQQRIMYMQYVQPGRTHARSTQAASALVAGETVATGTYLRDCNHAESEVSAEAVQADDTLTAAGAHSATSVAEAYPDSEPVVQVSINADVAPQVETEAEPAPESNPSENDDASKVPRDLVFNDEEVAAAVPAPGPVADEESIVAPVAVESELPAPIAPVASVVPANRYLPAKKKVIVELDQSPEEDEEPQAAAFEDEQEVENAVSDDVEEDEEELSVPVKPVNPVRVPNARRPAVKKPVKAAPAGGKPAKKPAAPLPAGTFFPIDFGGTNGGAIAIANSFSTGEGGSATSHAIAYGSPESASRRVRPNPSKFRH
ncbi:transcriptional regulatory protein AlgP isoform X1 [Drosophila ananassae]|uniref:transcriptional regulatory protein AlgP isoform X1 n=1 Tax=Drosophila ananassae TaxID=7217 RepID=UPI0013A5CD2D|nr:transcriptional regulatory protein AlgP isoform X1 [Drosophila ananassae]